jgi:hypothetical protein
LDSNYQGEIMAKLIALAIVFCVMRATQSVAGENNASDFDTTGSVSDVNVVQMLTPATPQVVVENRVSDSDIGIPPPVMVTDVPVGQMLTFDSPPVIFDAAIPAQLIFSEPIARATLSVTDIKAGSMLQRDDATSVDILELDERGVLVDHLEIGCDDTPQTLTLASARPLRSVIINGHGETIRGVVTGVESIRP